MAVAMRDTGCPQDQAERFITAGYVPLEGMLQFHAWAREADTVSGPSMIALGGKRGPGKSHTIMAQVGLDDCQRYAGLKVLFLRKIQKAAAESFEDVILRVFAFTPHTSNRDGVKFPNGSRIIIGGFKDEKDIEKYLGIEYDIIVIEEVTQITDTKWMKIQGSLRTSKPRWRPRIYASANADGVGLGWFKKMFVEPARAGTEKITRFLDVTKIHNPFVNVEYEQWLDNLKGSLRKAWRDGDWDAFAGMAFPMWNHARHVVEPFDIPDAWIKWRAIDYGTAAPWCCLWLTRDPSTRRIYVYREAYQAGLTTKEQCDRIHDLTQSNEKIAYTYADPAMWQRSNRRGEVYSTADEYKEYGIPLTRADNDRIQGKRKFGNVLSDIGDGLPGMQVFDICENLISQIENIPSDPNNPEDVDTKAEDHAYDAGRYSLTNERKVESTPPEAKKFIHPLAGMKGL